jgi:hypothetical protein
MFKRNHYIALLCGTILIGIGILDIVSFIFPVVMLLKKTFSSTSDDMRHIVMLFVYIGSLFAILFAFSFILSGIGIIRLKEWARKLALWTVGLHILIILPVAPGKIDIGIEKIIIICISIAIFYFLLKKSIKEQFEKGNKVSP